MEPYAELTPVGQFRRVRAVAERTVVPRFLGERTLWLRGLNHGENTTFDVGREGTGRGPPARFCLRLSRPGYQRPEWIRSELDWLRALAEAGFRVPAPVPATDGTWVVPVRDPTLDGERWAAMFHWVEGRFRRRDRLLPVHLHRVGRLTARLHAHARAWRRPRAFTRPRWDWDGYFGETAVFAPWRTVGAGAPKDEFLASDHPVARLLSRADRATLARAEDRLRGVFRDLGDSDDATGLLHADLHAMNVLFSDGEAAAIDFDDCGTGYWLSDLGVTSSHLGDRWDDRSLCDALVAGYREVAPLSPAAAALIPTFVACRRVQMVYSMLSRCTTAASIAGRAPWVRKFCATVATIIPARRR